MFKSIDMTKEDGTKEDVTKEYVFNGRDKRSEEVTILSYPGVPVLQPMMTSSPFCSFFSSIDATKRYVKIAK